jgi:hypothetical protein
MVLIIQLPAGTRIAKDGTADQVLNLTVTPKPADAVTTQTICSGESFSWNGTDYTTTKLVQESLKMAVLLIKF